MDRGKEASTAQREKEIRTGETTTATAEEEAGSFGDMYLSELSKSGGGVGDKGAGAGRKKLSKGSAYLGMSKLDFVVVVVVVLLLLPLTAI
jgi:cobalamin biosynthesis Mg chelatase CobN